MKFYCDSCNTKYSIADAKVRGKVLKVRCKKCENIITVREARTPEAATAGTSGAAGDVPRANWYYAVNGVTSGPFDLDDVKGKFATGEVGDEAYVWHDTFDSWKPVASVDIFKSSLAQGQALKPRARTLGFTGKLQAVTAPDGASAERSGEVPRPSTSAKSASPKSPSSEGPKSAKPESAKPEPAKPESAKPESAKPEPAAAKPAAAKPESAKPAAAKPTPAAAKPTPAAAKPASAKPTPDAKASKASAATSAPKLAPKSTEPATTADDDAPASTSREPDNDVREDKLAALRAKLKAKKAGEQASKPAAALPERKPVESTQQSAEEEAPKSAPVSLAAPPAVEQAPTEEADIPEPSAPEPEPDVVPGFPTPANPSTTSTSDIFEVPAPADEDDVEDDQDSVPFFPAAAAAPAPNEQSALTGSLLIQLDQIQKKGRGGKLLAIAAIVVVLLLVGGVATYIMLQPPMEESEFAAPQGPGSGEHRELNLKRYSDNDQRKILELGEEAIEEMEFEAEDEPTEAPSKKAPKVVAKASPKSTTKEKTPEPSVESDEPEEESAESDNGVAMAAARIKTTDDDGSVSAEATRRKAELFRSATSTKREETTIARPEDSLAGRASSKNKLTREQALEGMKRVSRSVSLCRERHMRRGGSFDSQKIFVTVTVKGSGEVSDFKAEPAALQNTEFGRCMNSHKGRWRFAAFGGDPQPVRRRFIIQ